MSTDAAARAAARGAGSTTALWFPLEAALREVQDLCVGARAAQIAVERARARAPVAAAGAPGEAPLDAEADPRLARAPELARELARRGEPPAGPDLVALRAIVRQRLVELRAAFAEVLSEHDVYYALFPVVVYVDELVQISTRGEAARWEPLQGELYEIDNGGELFFTVAEDKLRQQETHPFVFEVFYFCLADGFAGMHQGHRKKLDEYAARLAERIPLRPAPAAAPPRPARGVELVAFPWPYYAVASGVVVATYLALSWFGTP
ncbi:MAG TPA: DotU family type IV/VI secretion system protein [Polyangiaceae bacterium]|nr:DotU family type IV/VI secretion system protein [Polyangiaceae bacterium]